MKQIVKTIRSSWLKILAHTLFWAGVLMFYTLFFGHQEGNYPITFRFVIRLLPVAIVTTYVFNYYLLPRFYFKQKYWQFGLFTFYTLVVSVDISLLLIMIPVIEIIDMQGKLDPTFIDVYFLLVGIYFIVILAVTIKLFKYSHEQQNKTLNLLKEKTEMELTALRNQINPHFLFNTLNNIYSLALKKSEMTAEVVMKLSNILDYVLYETKAETVELNKEIALIENYLSIQEIRFSNRLKTTLKMNGQADGVYIAPMILLPFVENSFKHGVSNNRKDAYIFISIVLGANYIQATIENSRPSHISSSEINDRHGIGHGNVAKRLDLLYKDNYDFDIEKDDHSYKVTLKLPLIRK